MHLSHLCISLSLYLGIGANHYICFFFADVWGFVVDGGDGLFDFILLVCVSFVGLFTFSYTRPGVRIIQI